MPLAVITVDVPALALEKRHQEVRVIARALRLAEQAICSTNGQQTSGDIMTDGATVIGSWKYSPTATN
jgi:hypothetical protein